jgi:hypothetical protein
MKEHTVNTVGTGTAGHGHKKYRNVRAKVGGDDQLRAKRVMVALDGKKLGTYHSTREDIPEST